MVTALAEAQTGGRPNCVTSAHRWLPGGGGVSSTPPETKEL